jgi:uncharacterized protein (PEP-CTERM system associated)
MRSLGRGISKRASLYGGAQMLAVVLLGGAALTGGAAAQQLPLPLLLPRPQPLTPVQAPTKDVVLTPLVGVQEMVTDNVYDTQTNRQVDAITRLFAGGDLEVNTGPTVLHLNGLASYDIYANASKLDSWNLDFNGTGHYDVVPDFLSIQAEGAVTQGYLSTYGTPAIERNNGGNQLRLMDYDIGPRLATTVDNFADLVVNARFAQVLFDNLQSTALPVALTNSSIYQSTARLDTADRYQDLQLISSGEFLEDDHNFQLYNGLQTAFIRVAPLIRLIARGGYESIRDPGVVNLNSPIWTAGVEYTLAPGSVISIEGGNRFDRVVWNANIHVEITDRLYATGRFLESVEPQNARLNRSLTDILSQSETEPPFVSSQIFSLNQNLTNMTAFDKEGSGRLVYTWAAQTIDFSMDWLEQDFFQAATTQNRQLSMAAGYTRQIRPDFSAALKLYYAHTFSSPLFGKSDVYQVGLSGSYLLSSTITLNGGYVYQLQQQLFANGQRIDENTVYVSIAKSF